MIGIGVSAAFSTGVDLLTLANTFVGSSVTHNMTYTPGHRMKDETVSSAAWRFAPAAVETTTYAAANNLNQYTQVTKGANPTVTLAYDASGNLTGDGTWTFAYDAENKLRTATKAGTSAAYAYDPLLRRQGKTVNGVTTTFLLDGAEEIGDYDGTGAMLRRYVPSNGTDAPIAMIEGTGGSTVRQWFHRNRLGSTIAMSNGSGAVSEGPITYDPFGNSTSTGGVPFKYTGRRYDAETGLYYYRARYYSSALGRFLQTDPIGTCDNINLYAYVGNDPVNRTDPYGLAEKKVEKVVVIGTRPRGGNSGGVPFGGGGWNSETEAGTPQRVEYSDETNEDGTVTKTKVTVTAQRQEKKKKNGSNGGVPGDMLAPEDRAFICYETCRKGCEREMGYWEALCMLPAGPFIGTIKIGRFKIESPWHNFAVCGVLPATYGLISYFDAVQDCTNDCSKANC